MEFRKTEFAGHVRLTFLATLVGLIAGLASVAFKYMIHFFQGQFWRAPSILEAVSSQGWYLTILIPAFGGLLVGPPTGTSSPSKLPQFWTMGSGENTFSHLTCFRYGLP